MDVRSFRTCFLIWMWIVLIQSVLFTNGEFDYSLREEYDICRPNLPGLVPPTVYLEAPGIETKLYVIKVASSEKQYQCPMFFKTCADCWVCVESTADHDLGDRECNERCPFQFHFFDNDYKNKTMKSLSAGESMNQDFCSESRSLQIIFDVQNRFWGGFRPQRFRIYSKEKRVVIKGNPFYGNLFISSPFFPGPCIQNGETYTYDIETSFGDFITVTFDDWLLSPHSTFQFRYSNIAGSVSSRHRPPYVISDGSRMQIKFYTGDYTIAGSHSSYPGFKAHLRFYDRRSEIPQIRTNCGSLLMLSNGGVIEKPYSNSMIMDCIWVIKKQWTAAGMIIIPEKFVSMDTSEHMELEIRSGLTSENKLITKEVSTHFNKPISPFILQKSAYIRLRGRINPDDSVMIVYSSFTQGIRNCKTYFREHYLCDNLRCIDYKFRCDGYNQCGDGSDENKNKCSPDDDVVSSSSHVKVAIIVPLIVSLVVILLFTLILVFLKRCRRLSAQQRLQEQRSTGRAQQGPSRAQNIQMSVTVSSGEHPPSYNEVMSNMGVGNVNVAFSWSTAEPSTSPPSYHEAISAVNFDMSQPSSDLSLNSHGSVDGNSTAEITFDTTDYADFSPDNHHENLLIPNFLMTNSTASLDPGADVSSSSSSDDNYDHRENNQDSESSTDNDSPYQELFVGMNSNVHYRARPTSDSCGVGGMDSGTSRDNDDSMNTNDMRVTVDARSDGNHRRSDSKDSSNGRWQRTRRRREEENSKGESTNLARGNRMRQKPERKQNDDVTSTASPLLTTKYLHPEDSGTDDQSTPLSQVVFRTTNEGSFV